MPDIHPTEILAITTTVASPTEAQALARLLVERRLAACVQVEPGLQSLYRWDGRLFEEAELRLTVKTVPACRPAIETLFAEHHPYELPQFAVVAMQASEAYAAWVRREVQVPPPISAEPDPV